MLVTAAASSNAETTTKGKASAPAPYFDIQGALQGLGKSTYPSIYAGMVSNSGDDQSLTIYLTRVNQAAESAFNAIASEAPDTHLSFALAAHSLSFIDNLRDQVTADDDDLSADGIQTTQWGPDPRTGLLEIDVVSPTAANIAELQRDYGAANIEIVPVTSDDYYTVDSGRMPAPRAKTAADAFA
ncbi:MAG: hypothetical protein INR62_09050 [Rhodospirillales bacterium]|nr:hypothetical protein [Acetobacter sp.]